MGNYPSVPNITIKVFTGKGEAGGLVKGDVKGETGQSEV